MTIIAQIDLLYYRSTTMSQSILIMKATLFLIFVLVYKIEATTCPDGTTDVPDGYGATNYTNLFYKGNLSLVTYFDAYLSCLDDGGRLAMFKDHIQLADLRRVRDGLMTDAWTGLMKDEPVLCWSYTDCDGKLVWADGSTYQSAPLDPLAPGMNIDVA